MKLIFSVLLLFVSSEAWSRSLSFKENGVAAHFQGSFGSTILGEAPYADNIGSGVTAEGTHQWLMGGQMGLVLAPQESLAFIFGLEVLKPISAEGKGKNTGGTEMYQYSSSGYAFNPFFATEISYSVTPVARYFLGIGLGYAQLNMSSKFDMTPQGTTELGASSFEEKMQAMGVLNGYLSLGMERMLVDTSTFVAQVGYRAFKVYELKHTSDATTIAEGAVASGDTVLNSDGSKRQLDLGGVFVAFGFRFYIP